MARQLLLAVMASHLAVLTAAQASCSAQGFVAVPNFQEPQACVPSGYGSAIDLGYSTQASVTAQCGARCNALGTSCSAYVGQLQQSPDGTATGQCFFYPAVPTAPMPCAQGPSIIFAHAKDSTSDCFSSNALSATAYCSSYLSIGTVTVYTSTSTPLTTLSVTSTSTKTDKATTTLSTPTTKVVRTTETDTVISTLLSVTTTSTTSTFVVTSTTSSSVSAFKRSLGAVAAPTCLSAAEPAYGISAACSCLSIASPTVYQVTTLPTQTVYTTIPAKATTTSTKSVTKPYTITTVSTKHSTTKTSITLSSTQTVISTSTSTTNVAPAPTDILTNGDFEQGTSPWTISIGQSGPSDITSDAEHGSSALRLSFTSGLSSSVSQEVVFSPQQKYLATAYVKTNSCTGIRLFVYSYGNNAIIGSTLNAVGGQNNGYSQLSFTFTFVPSTRSPSDFTGQVSVDWNCFTGSYLELDNFSVVPTN